jgi:hypothetical protein
MKHASTFHVFSAYRTAICKATKGGFKDTPAVDLLVPLFKVCVCHPLSLLQRKWQFSQPFPTVSSSLESSHIFLVPIIGFGG